MNIRDKCETPTAQSHGSSLLSGKTMRQILRRMKLFSSHFTKRKITPGGIHLMRKDIL